MNNELRIKALNSVGNKTEYFSLKLPENFVNGGDSLSLEFQLVGGEEYFAKKSKFYGKIMTDGNIFNPYIHRRFLPSRFLQMFFSKQGFNSCLDEDYNHNYSIRTTIKEIRKLALLQTIDKTAFAERSLFFTLDAVKQIFKDYTKGILKSNAETITRLQKSKHDYSKYTTIIAIENAKYTKLSSNIQYAKSYDEVCKILDKFGRLAKLNRKTRKSSAFKTAYKASGAYYTMKHLIMFEGCKFKGLNDVQSLATLKAHLYTVELYRLSGIFKDFMADNNYSCLIKK